MAQQIEQTVYIVDNDEAIREAMAFLMESVGLPCKLYCSAQEFLDDYSPQMSGCLVLDVRMPKMSGMELQQKLNERQVSLPIIFISGHGDVPMAVKAMRQGAFDFIPKPFRDQELLDRINLALEQEAQLRLVHQQLSQIKERLATLTGREREILDNIVMGKSNKLIAIELELSQRTVEIHRSRVMEKMACDSLAELVHDITLIKSADA